MKRRLILTLVIASVGLTEMSGQTKETYNDSGIAAGFFDNTEGSGNINFSSFHLPPLAVLLENAKQNPQILSLAKAEELARAEVLKEKKNVFSFVSGHASYSYGKTDLWGNNSTTLNPIIYQYQGNEQSYWNVGATLSVPLDELLDLGQSVKRKRLEAEQLEQDKDYAFDQLKLQIASLYIKITNDITALKTAGESAAAYQGAGVLDKEEFENGNIDITDYAWHKMQEMGTVTEFQNLQTTIMTNIITLEILTHTPIITNSTTEITLERMNDKDTQDQLKKQAKAEKKALKEQIEADAKAEKELLEKEAKEAKEAQKAAAKAQKALKSQSKNNK